VYPMSVSYFLCLGLCIFVAHSFTLAGVRSDVVSTADVFNVRPSNPYVSEFRVVFVLWCLPILTVGGCARADTVTPATLILVLQRCSATRHLTPQHLPNLLGHGFPHPGERHER